ncbi:MAG: PAS domain S-box protein [Nitrospiraceae bacterium]|nr:MAG: PAS domain S-box protein [Nitrospiraceae bacterium]
MRKELSKRLQALILIRVIVVTLLLGSFYVFRIGYDKLLHPAAFSSFIIFLYLLTIFYALIMRWVKQDRHFYIFAYVQIVIDIVSEVALIYITGGIASIFSFMFPLSILSAGIVLNRRACYIISTLSSILYGTLLDLQYYNMIKTPPGVFFTERDFLYNIFAAFMAFYLVAFLSGYLSDKLSRATRSLEERDTVLSDLKAFSRYIIESMPSGVFTTDLSRRIITFNSSAQDITKLSQNEVTGKTPEDIFPFLQDFTEPLDRIEGEMQRNGDTFPVGMRLSPLKDGAGKSIGMIGIFQDLTELKAMEAEVKRKEKWAFIGELSASIAHELRNPLAALKASVEMLQERKVSGEEADRLMQIALSEMDRLNGIITDFLLYARPQNLNKKPFDLHQSLRDVVTLLQSAETDRKNVTISAKLEGSLVITGDAKQMQQVFWNLGINALDAISENGSVDIYTSKKTGAVEVVFRDTGTGISAGDIENIFYPFYTTKEKGTGLGLSIAQKITEEHGGKIVVQSKGAGTGTTFKVILPVT